MHSVNELLIDQLNVISRHFASFATVIMHAAESLTRGSGKNDLSHSEAVYNRLSQIFPNAKDFGLNEAEIFILIASAYLHDIGHLKNKNGQKHGELSANMICNDKLEHLFPAGDIRNQVAKICYCHDREVKDLEKLDNDFELDIRPCQCSIRRGMKVRPKMLCAIFILADELECISDRFLSQCHNDPRTIISAVRIDLEERCISLDFEFGVEETDQKKCVDYLHSKLEELNPFLNSYGLSFKIVDKSPETKPIDEEEGVDEELYASNNEEVSEPSIKTQSTSNFKNLNKMLKSRRMNRINRVISVLSKRGIRE